MKNNLTKFSKKVHCAGVMSFDFGSDPIYKEFSDFIDKINVLVPAKVYDYASLDGKVDQDVRICHHYKDIEDLTSKYPEIERFAFHFHKMMELTSWEYMEEHKMTNLDAFDFLEVLKYTPGGKYEPHVDQYTGDREVSCIIYLNDVEKGGETYFPKTYNKKGQAIKIKPKAGRVLLFQCGHSSIHAALPVKKGYKTVIYTFLCQESSNEGMRESLYDFR